MNRLVAGLLGVSLGIVVAGAPAPMQAQDSGRPTSVINNLGDYSPPSGSGNGRDGVEVARGDSADTITYTIVESPDTTAAPPEAVYPEAPRPPDLSSVPVVTSDDESTTVPPAGEPVPAAVDPAQPGGVVGDASTVDPNAAPVAAAAPESTVETCASFPSWYDAQVYYESVGGTAAAPELVASLDPDYDGVSCEEIMEPY